MRAQKSSQQAFKEMEQTTLRTFTIVVYNSNGSQLFRSKDDLPAELREQLESTMQSSNAATILLADRNGRQELAKALRGAPSALSDRYAPKAIAVGLTESTAELAAPSRKTFQYQGIGLVSRTKLIALGFTITLLGIIALFTLKIFSR